MIVCSKEMLLGNHFSGENHSLSKIMEMLAVKVSDV